LEEQRLALMEEVQSYRRRIKQLEDDLLFRLSNSQASIHRQHRPKQRENEPP
jgi:dynein heavy chain